MAKAGCELYRDHFDGLIRKPNGKLRRLTSTCCVRFIFIFFFFFGGGEGESAKTYYKTTHPTVYWSHVFDYCFLIIAMLSSSLYCSRIAGYRIICTHCLRVFRETHKYWQFVLINSFRMCINFIHFLSFN